MLAIDVSLWLARILFLASGCLAAQGLVTDKVRYERGSLRAMRWGLPFLTLHMFLLSIRAYRFQGSAWNWAPDQVGLWILWLFFVMMVHLPRPSRKSAVATCLGCLVGVMLALQSFIQR